ncbi:helix-turn-helix-domain containing protein type [Apiospora kogelbergensis]|uniref:Helix-turn-helix-domain containing protein type n=1 Tax=Apiospora kogelbergensis TaxID=1337665 RepID=A0AAW0Q904_9PEZI
MSSLYDISIPVYTDITKTAVSILKKGEEHFKSQGKDTAELLKLKIADDMLPLNMQILIIVMTGRKLVERVANAAPVDTPINQEYTLAELQGLLDAQLAELAKVDRAQVDGREQTEVPCKFGPEEYKSSALDYVSGYPIPTGYFHLNMLYALLRGAGVPLGKRDYMAEFMKKMTKA